MNTKKIFLQVVVSVGFIVIGISGYRLKQNYDMQSDIEEKRALITLGLKDPSSAQFRNELMNKSKWLCGEINAKNDYGAYTGFKKFVAFDSSKAYLESIGSVGTIVGGDQVSRNTDFRIKQIQREIEIIDYREKYGTNPTFGSLTDEDKSRELFQEVWKSVCS